MLFIHIMKKPFNLIIQLIPVCNNNNMAIRDILNNPLGKPNHNERLTGTLGIPDNPALIGFDTLTCCNISKILIMSGKLLFPGIKYNKIMNH